MLAGLALGVAAVGAAGSMVSSVEAGLSHNARALLGSDVEASRLYRPPTVDERARLAGLGTLSEVAETRAMARRADGEGRALLVELNAVDAAHPLVGAVRLEPARPLAEALAARNGVSGVAAAPQLLRRLNLGVGDALRIGAADFEIRAVLLAEPDAAARAFGPGPRVMLDAAGLATTGLVRPGSLITHAMRIAAPRLTSGAVKAALADPA